MSTPQEHHTNFGLDVPAADEATSASGHHVVPAHLDEHAREEMLEGHHPDHGTNFGIVLPVDED